MTTAQDIKEALHRRYNATSQGREGEQYICIEEARSGAGFSGNNGQCDFLAINTWQSRGMELIGHEVKVSLSDWKKELASPEKAEVFAQFCRRWYVVVPTDLAAKIKHEIPPAWGLLSVSDKGAVREVVKPTARKDAVEVPAWWWVGWMAQIDRQHKRRLPYLISERLKPEREKMEAFMADHANRRAAAQDEAVLERLNRLDEFERKTGMSLRHMYGWDLDRLASMLKAVRGGVDMEGLRNQLRATVERLDVIIEHADAVPS